MMIQYPLKRWLMFAGSDYYPLGGSRDLRGSFDSKEVAVFAFKSLPISSIWQWAIVFCQQTGEATRWAADGGMWVEVPMEEEPDE